MAKEKKVEKAAPAEKAEAVTFKYGVSDLAEKLGIGEASVRVKLRNAGIEKSGKSYGWNTKAELAEVVDSLTEEKPTKTKKADKDEKPTKAKAKPEADEKPAKAKKAKKPKDEDDD